MTNTFIVNAVDRCLQDIRGDERSFGGLTICFAGDFRQTLPVVRHGSRADIVRSTICSSKVWRKVQSLSLSSNMRLRPNTSANITTMLLQIGQGITNTYTIEKSQLVKTQDELIDSVYNTFDSEQYDDYFARRAILSATNETVDELNAAILSRWPGEPIMSHSWDRYESDDPSASYAADALASQNIAGFPLYQLILKKNVPIILLRNINPSKGLCNGTRMKVDDVSPNVIKATILNGSHAGSLALIPKITLSFSTSLPFTLIRRQFPIRVAFAMTINKAQGQTLSTVGLDFTTPAFTHGQLYVALSRSSSWNNISFLTHQTDQLTNIVYKEIFQLARTRF